MNRERSKDLALKAIGETSYVNIVSNTSATIEGCTQILECNEILSRIKTRQFIIEISGSEPKMNCYNNGSVTVCGLISGVSIIPLERR